MKANTNVFWKKIKLAILETGDLLLHHKLRVTPLPICVLRVLFGQLRNFMYLYSIWVVNNCLLQPVRWGGCEFEAVYSWGGSGGECEMSQHYTAWSRSLHQPSSIYVSKVQSWICHCRGLYGEWSMCFMVIPLWNPEYPVPTVLR